MSEKFPNESDYAEQLKAVGQDENREGLTLLESYDWFADPEVTKSMVDAVYESLTNRHIYPGVRLNILGLGSGTAQMEIEIKNTLQNNYVGSNLTVTDRFPALKELLPENVNFVIADVQHLPLTPDSQDLILSRSVNHYQTGEGVEKKFYEEVARVLKPGGIYLNQTISLESEAECELLMKIHALVPKIVDLKNRARLEEILREVFGGVTKTESQTARELEITKKGFIARFGPKEKDFGNIDEYKTAINEFEKKIAQITDLIKSVPESDRPHIWLTNNDFGFNIPYTIFKCIKTELD